MKFLLIVLGGITGNGIGAWNIRTISSGRYVATAFLTFIAAVINMTMIRSITRDVNGIYILAYAVGSTIGIVGAVVVDRKYFHKDFSNEDRN